MHIAICDDDYTIYTELTSYISVFFADCEKVSIDTYASGEQLLAAQKKYDILFIDIYMKELNGIETAEKLKSRNSTCIVFMTTSSDHAVEAFRLNAVHYLVKPIQEKDVYTALERCLNTLSTHSRETMHCGSLTLPYHRVLYIESANKRVLIHTDAKIYTVYQTLETIYADLSHDTFMRAQRSFIVNMSHITDFYHDHVVLSDGTSITLSRIHQEDLKKQYRQYLFQLTRRTL